MSLWGFIKSMFGMGSKEPEYPTYIPPPPEYVMPRRPLVIAPDDQGVHRDKHWEEMKKRYDEKMKWEQKKRSRYGGA